MSDKPKRKIIPRCPVCNSQDIIKTEQTLKCNKCKYIMDKTHGIEI